MVDRVFSDSVEPHCYPGTNVFINLLNEVDARSLEEAEAAYTAIRYAELHNHPHIVPQTFDFAHLKAIHCYLFQDLFDWAGRPRSYDVAKNGDRFTDATDLPKYESTVFARSLELAALGRGSKEEVTARLAKCLGIINIYHPFPEGNGRTQRVFIGHLARQVGYEVDWDAVHTWEMVETCKRVHEGDYEPMIRMFERIVLELN